MSESSTLKQLQKTVSYLQRSQHTHDIELIQNTCEVEELDERIVEQLQLAGVAHHAQPVDVRREDAGVVSQPLAAQPRDVLADAARVYKKQQQSDDGLTDVTAGTSVSHNHIVFFIST